MSSLEYFYGEYGDVEERFLAKLDKSLDPRGRDMLYDVLAALQLDAATRVLDLGCGEGTYSIELARRFGFSVLGVDPFPRTSQVELEPAIEKLVTFEAGRAEQLPVADGSIDLIWCRDVLVHMQDVGRVFAECRRVLRPGGHMLILHSLASDRFPPAEAAWLWSAMHVVPPNTDATFFEAALTAAGFEIQQRVDVGSEWREYLEESTGKGRLLHAARLLRQPQRYIAEFGQDAYDIMLGDCYWHIYQMLGLFSYRIYVVQRATSNGSG